MSRASRARFITAGLLFAVIFSSASSAGAQTPGYTVDDLATLVSGGVAAARVVELATADCLAEPVDEPATERLRRAGATDDLIRQLQRVCYSGPTLEVSTEPGGADVVVGGRAVGQAPVQVDLHPAATASVIVRKGSWANRLMAPLKAGYVTELHFAVPYDLMPLPGEPTRTTVAERMGLLSHWQASTSPPREPTPPWSDWDMVLPSVGAVAVGLAAVLAVPCNAEATDPLNDWETSCDSRHTWAGIGGIGTGGVLGFFLGRRIKRSAQSRYVEASRSYPARLAAWRDQQAAEREQWLATNPQLAAEYERALAAYRAEAARVQAENGRRQTRNSSLPGPSVRLVPKSPR